MWGRKCGKMSGEMVGKALNNAVGKCWEEDVPWFSASHFLGHGWDSAVSVVPWCDCDSIGPWFEMAPHGSPRQYTRSRLGRHTLVASLGKTARSTSSSFLHLLFRSILLILFFGCSTKHMNKATGKMFDSRYVLFRKRRTRRSSVSAIRPVRWVHPTSSRRWVSRACLLHPLPVCAVVVNPPAVDHLDQSLHGNGPSSGGLLHGHRWPVWSTASVTRCLDWEELPFRPAPHVTFAVDVADGFTASPMQSIVEALESGKKGRLDWSNDYDWKVARGWINSGDYWRPQKIGWMII